MVLHVLGCRVDILGTNCKKLLKVKVRGAGGGVERVALASVKVLMMMMVAFISALYSSLEQTHCARV